MTILVRSLCIEEPAHAKGHPRASLALPHKVKEHHEREPGYCDRRIFCLCRQNIHRPGCNCSLPPMGGRSRIAIGQGSEQVYMPLISSGSKACPQPDLSVGPALQHRAGWLKARAVGMHEDKASRNNRHSCSQTYQPLMGQLTGAHLHPTATRCMSCRNKSARLLS